MSGAHTEANKHITCQSKYIYKKRVRRTRRQPKHAHITGQHKTQPCMQGDFRQGLPHRIYLSTTKSIYCVVLVLALALALALAPSRHEHTLDSRNNKAARLNCFASASTSLPTSLAWNGKSASAHTISIASCHLSFIRHLVGGQYSLSLSLSLSSNSALGTFSLLVSVTQI